MKEEVAELLERVSDLEQSVARWDAIVQSLLNRLGMVVIETPFVVHESKIDKIEALVNGGSGEIGFNKEG